jgi:hypothetical protein
VSAKSTPNSAQAADPVAARRQRDNVRLGLGLGALAVVLFLIALWKYRPL